MSVQADLDWVRPRNRPAMVERVLPFSKRHSDVTWMYKRHPRVDLLHSGPRCYVRMPDGQRLCFPDWYSYGVEFAGAVMYHLNTNNHEHSRSEQ